MFREAEPPMFKQNCHGTYTLESLHLVHVSLHGPEGGPSCKVQHEARPPIRANFPLSTVAHATYKPLGVQPNSPLLLGAAESLLSPEWTEVFKPPEPHCLLLPIDPETPAVIFVVFLLGLKVLLVISFTSIYIRRWWHLKQVSQGQALVLRKGGWAIVMGWRREARVHPDGHVVPRSLMQPHEKVVSSCFL